MVALLLAFVVLNHVVVAAVPPSAARLEMVDCASDQALSFQPSPGRASGSILLQHQPADACLSIHNATSPGTCNVSASHSDV
eukprot:COSAG02_NODE_832_length_16660_cov_16.228006_6_plen_82_part_00